jgi:hypothetical protein
MEIGSKVLVRDHMAGIHMGTLKSLDLAAKVCVLVNARKIWSWLGAGSCHGIAAHGIRGGRVAPLVDEVASCAVVEVVAVTDAAWESVMGQPEWRP